MFHISHSLIHSNTMCGNLSSSFSCIFMIWWTWTNVDTRLRNFGVKPPKRGIELGWVTRGTRPKKPSSSCGFTHEAHGARGARGSWGSWGLKTENQTFFSFLFQQATTKLFIYLFIYLFSSVRTTSTQTRTHQPIHAGRARRYGGEGEGQRGERAGPRRLAYVRADA
jgi:hypothetical protein